MPQVKKVAATPVKKSSMRRPSVNGSILSRAVDISEIEDEAVHMLIYGRNRIGKTTLACQFPKPLLLVAVEPAKTGGARSVKKVEGVQLLRLHKSGDVADLGHELLADNPYATVILDSGTSLDEMVLADVCEWENTAEMLRFGRVSQDQYTERSERMRKVMRPYFELSSNFILICNEKDHNPPEGRKSAMTRGMQTESFFAAAMSAGTTRWAQDGLDYVCQLYMDKVFDIKRVKAGKGTIEVPSEIPRFVRRLRCGYHPNFAAGFRSDTPEAVPEFIDDPTYEKIMAVVRGETE